MSDAGWLLGLAGAGVFGAGLWLRRAQARFAAGLRAAGDPLVDHPGSKLFRQRFTAWLFGLGEADPPGLGKSLLTLLMLAALGAAAAYSLLPGVFE